jgi:uncharacterized protein
MGSRERYTPGTFCWADLGVTDRDGAKAFYGELFGWEAEDQTGPRGNVYTFLRQDGAAVTALRDGEPVWISYVSVEDVDATLERAREAGASVVAEPRDVGPAGRSAVLSDPEGATFGLWQAGDFVGAGVVNDEGSMVWQQLSTSNVPAAKDWYGQLLGWTWEELEGSGGYELARTPDGRLNGGLAQLPVPGVTPTWEVCFTVADVAAACERAEELGGATIMPRMTSPVGDFAQVSDPQGAPLSFFAGDTDP